MIGDSLAERVAKGVERLDKRGPLYWRRRVDPDTLDLRSPFCCVLGQVYGSYTEGLDALELGSSVDYGFNSYGYDWSELTNEWKRVLTA